MRKIFTVLASFIIMLCIGSVYAWSIIASELVENYNFSASQAQLVFGTIIAVFPTTMIFVGRLGSTFRYKHLGYISGLLFILGYLTASYSSGNFAVILLGIGVLLGISTGFGYWVSLTSSVQCFPKRKGLITGIAAAGFGLGAVFMSGFSENMLLQGKDVLQLFKVVGVAYGLIILILSNLLYQVPTLSSKIDVPVTSVNFKGSKTFKKLFLGIFLGTFAGLLIIGSLKIIGGQNNISAHYLVLGVTIFSIANFLGRLTWGVLSDHLGASLGIFLAFLCQSVSIFSLNFAPLSGIAYLILAFFIGFGFGGNFVLFAKETAQEFGVKNLGIVYPYVFEGYAIAGIVGPTCGGVMFDLSGSYYYAIMLAGLMSLVGGLLFLNHHFAMQRDQKHFNFQNKPD